MMRPVVIRTCGRRMFFFKKTLPMRVSNCGPLVSKTTALPTEPQPLLFVYLFAHPFHFSINHRFFPYVYTVEILYLFFSLRQ